MIHQRVTIDPETVKRNNLTLGEFLFTLSYMWGFNFEEVIEHMVSMGTAHYEVDTPVPNPIAIRRVHNCLGDVVELTFKPQELEDLAAQLKEIYPKGKSESGYYWSEGKKLVAKRLEEFFVKYGEYTPQEVIDATKRYVDEMTGQENMRTLRNFIFKEKVSPTGITETFSDLYTYIENKDEETKPKEDWTVEVR